MQNDAATKTSLLAVVGMPGFPLVLELMERQVTLMELAVFNIDPANEKEVLANHRMATGARLSYENFKKDLHKRIAPTEPPKELSQQQLEEIHIASL